jgi:predicted glycosyltransferase
MRRRRILYYCQSLVGIGHLTASLRIARELLAQHDVDFIQGGLDMAGGLEHAAYRNLKLATLLHDDDSGGLVDPEGGASSDALWHTRADAISHFLRPPYDAIVVEFFPFGRRRFRREIYALFDAVRAASGAIPIFCSVREVLVPADARTERKIVAMVNRDIDTIFVRGDPAVVALDETFREVDAIRAKLVYTGYVAPDAPAAWPPRQRKILVSQGGGDVGRELLRAAALAAPSLPDYRFVLAAGSRTSTQAIEELKGSVRSDNVEIVPFLPNFQQHLLESALSISLGGDNTMLDVISTRTPALAYPYQGSSEQAVRIAKLATAGFVHALEPVDLEPARLRARIEHALATPYPQHRIAADGARLTARAISTILEQRRAPIRPAPRTP